jgi:hypothetical protein
MHTLNPVHNHQITTFVSVIFQYIIFHCGELVLVVNLPRNPYWFIYENYPLLNTESFPLIYSSHSLVFYKPKNLKDHYGVSLLEGLLVFAVVFYSRILF